MLVEPNWHAAPGWAEWWAVDWDGRAYWYEYAPTIIGTAWYLGSNHNGGRTKRCGQILVDAYPAWRQSLRRRPQ